MNNVKFELNINPTDLQRNRNKKHCLIVVQNSFINEYATESCIDLTDINSLIEI